MHSKLRTTHRCEPPFGWVKCILLYRIGFCELYQIFNFIYYNSCINNRFLPSTAIGGQPKYIISLLVQIMDLNWELKCKETSSLGVPPFSTPVPPLAQLMPQCICNRQISFWWIQNYYTTVIRAWSISPRDISLEFFSISTHSVKSCVSYLNLLKGSLRHEI